MESDYKIRLLFINQMVEFNNLKISIFLNLSEVIKIGIHKNYKNLVEEMNLL